MPNLRAVFLLTAGALLSSCAASAQAQNIPSCSSAIKVRFDKYGMTHIPTGSTIWFTGVLKAVHTADGSAITSPIRIDVHQSRITFGSWPYVITMPDSTVVLDPSVSVPYRLWTGPQKLNVRYSPSQVSKEALFDALPYEAPAPFIPRSSGPVTWTATFAASRPGISIDWAWSAAVYSQFGAVGTFQLKPLSGPIAQVEPQAGPPDLYENADPAGTAEAYKQYVIAGAMGGGAPQYTGERSEPNSVTACPTAGSPDRAEFPGPIFPQRVGGFPQFVTPWMRGPVNNVQPANTQPFASPVTQRVTFADGSSAAAVDRCFAFDLCAQITYTDGSQLSIYSEGAAYCAPYVLDFNRTSGNRTIFSVSRNVDHDPQRLFGCGRSRDTHIPLDGGRATLMISENTDGTLKFNFATP
ncbi:MAG TPA: hypothetical protein VGX91_09835 [Candidatus Cybelea sp.]|nr:hypothetical protein [Candidatus Cybelea sp.]